MISSNDNMKEGTNDCEYMMNDAENNNNYSNDDDDDNTKDNSLLFVLYPRRWYVLLSFAILSMNSAWIWITWSPISIPMTHYWSSSSGSSGSGSSSFSFSSRSSIINSTSNDTITSITTAVPTTVTVSDVDNLMGIYMYIYVPFSFISLYCVVNYFGLKWGLLIGGTFNAIGAFIRYQYIHSYGAVYIGTVLCAIAQTFTLSTPPLLAGSWFPSNERGTATGLGVLANQFGTAIGLGVCLFVRFDYNNIHQNDDDGNEMEDDNNTSTDFERKLKTYLLIQFIVSIIAVILVAIFGGDKPPTPPSKAAAALLMKQHHKEIIIISSHIVDTEEKNQSSSSSLMTETSRLLSQKSSSSTDQCSNQPTSMIHHPVYYNNKPSYFNSIQLVMYDIDCINIIVSFGISVGIYYTIPTLLSQLTPQTFTPFMNACIGVLYEIMGVFASYTVGRWIDIYPNQHQIISISLLSTGVVCLILLAGALFGTTTILFSDEKITTYTDVPTIETETETITITTIISNSTQDPTSILLFIMNSFIIFGIIGTGTCLAAFNTVGIEYGTGLAYPADETAVAGLLECSAELFGFVWVTLSGLYIASVSTLIATSSISSTSSPTPTVTTFRDETIHDNHLTNNDHYNDSMMYQSTVIVSVFIIVLLVSIERIWNVKSPIKRPL